jgi:hypothetical protein
VRSALGTAQLISLWACSNLKKTGDMAVGQVGC